MRDLSRYVVAAVVLAALFAVAAWADRAARSSAAAAARQASAAAATPSHAMAVDVEESDQGYAMQAARIGMPFFTLGDMEDVEAVPGAAVPAGAACGAAALTSVRLEDPSDACWAAYASAVVRGDFAQAAAAVRTGCERYRRADYCEFLPVAGDLAGLEPSRKEERL